MEDRDIDKLFRDAFKEAESNPPADMWKRVEAELEKEDNIVLLPRKNKFSFLKYAAAVVFLIGAGIAVYLNQEKGNSRLKDNSHPKQAERTETRPEHRIIEHEKEIRVAQTTTSEEQTAQSPKKVLAQVAPNKKDVTPKQVSLQNTVKRNTHEEIYIPEEVEENPSQITAHNIEIPNKDISNQIPVRQVTEVEQLKPLIEPEEEMDNMYVSQPATTDNNTVVTNILNIISENIEIGTKKDIKFRSDDEGSIRIDFINSFVKNRLKKRK